jgi:hypothetical protein
MGFAMSEHVGRYTREQMLCAIRVVLERQFACNATLDSQTRIDEYFKAAGDWDDIDLADLWFALCRETAIKTEPGEWAGFLGTDAFRRGEWETRIAPGFTFGALADWMAKRAEGVSLSAINVLGRKCATAGAFYGIEDVARQVSPHVVRFGPSTPIQKRLRGRALSRFWRRLRWMTCDALPMLRTPKTAVAWDVLLLVSLVLIPLWLAVEVGAAEAFFAAIGILVFGLIVSIVVTCVTNPLPAGIRTFGELARRVADAPSVREQDSA